MLTFLINQCLHTEIYPTQLKLSRVKPLHNTLMSLLISLSKIFERVIFYQLLENFTNNCLLCVNQFGFRTEHSIKLALLRLVDSTNE